MSTDGLPQDEAAVEELLHAASSLRTLLLPAYEAAAGAALSPRSRGQCAVTALIVKAELGGRLVSTIINGESHWFNRLTMRGVTYDLDLTGDQFGWPEVQCMAEGKLYSTVRERASSEVLPETFLRACRLAQRAGIFGVAARLENDRRSAA